MKTDAISNIPRARSQIESSVNASISLEKKLISIKTIGGKNFCMVKPKEGSTLHELYENLKDMPEPDDKLQISAYQPKIQHHVKQVRPQPKPFSSERHMTIRNSNNTHFIMAKTAKDSALQEIFTNLHKENYEKLSKEIITV